MSRSTSLITWTSLTNDRFTSFTSCTLCFPLAAGDSEQNVKESKHTHAIYRDF